MNQAPPTSPIVFDLETADASELARRSDFVRLSGWMAPAGMLPGPVLRPNGHEIAKDLTGLARDTGAWTFVGNNTHAFDWVALALHHGVDLREFRGRTWDCEVAERLIDPPMSGKEGIPMMPRGYYGLDATAKRYEVPHKTDDLARLAREHGGYDQIPLDDPEYRSYLAGDLVASMSVYNSQQDKIPNMAYARREMDVALITGQMTANGCRVDVPELLRTLEEQARRKKANLAELAEITGMAITKEISSGRGSAKVWRTVPIANPIATDAGKEALIRALGEMGLKESSLPMTKKTRKLSTGKEDVDALITLVRTYQGTDPERVAKADRIVHTLELVKSVVGERTIFDTTNNSRVGDRVHPQIKSTQASGRWSVTGPGLTVFGKRQGRHVERRVIVSEPGEVLIAIDLDQVDMRGVAAHSGDERYLEIFRTGRDPHTEIAIAVFGDPKMRELAKPIGHGWNYGEGAKKIASQGIPIQAALKFDREMRRNYPRLVAWREEVRERGEAGELLDNGFGRLMRPFPEFSYTQAPALVGQGCTRDILAEGLLRMDPAIWPMMRVIVHDEVVFSVPEDDAEEIGREIQRAMSFDLADVTDGRLASVPITAGVSKPGRNWSQCYEK